MARLSEAEPPRGVAIPEAPGVVRVVAPNPGPMTCHGTNTWVVARDGGAVVIDPGPDDAGHVAAVLRVAGRVGCIVLSHAHADHVGGAAGLRALSGAPVVAHERFVSALVVPDRLVGDGAEVAGLGVVHTPGHAADHVCLAAAGGVLFSGDHVMGWSSTAVALPEGDMAAYLASLRRLLGRADRVYLPGHGPAVPAPAGLVRGLLRHRLEREAWLARRLGRGPAGLAALVAEGYPGLDAALLRAAEATVLAHLGKLRDDGVAEERDGVWRARAGAGP